MLDDEGCCRRNNSGSLTSGHVLGEALMALCKLGLDLSEGDLTQLRYERPYVARDGEDRKQGKHVRFGNSLPFLLLQWLELIAEVTFAVAGAGFFRYRALHA